MHLTITVYNVHIHIHILAKLKHEVSTKTGLVTRVDSGLRYWFYESRQNTVPCLLFVCFSTWKRPYNIFGFTSVFPSAIGTDFIMRDYKQDNKSYVDKFGWFICEFADN